MIRSLWSGATGMSAQQFHLDVIANNLANVNTAGYKRDRAEFEDLLYATLRLPGTPIGGGGSVPTGVQVGHGTKITGTQKIHTPGSLGETQNPYDLAIEGQGFFQVLLPDGEVGYTRAGSFSKDADGKITNPNGYILQPEIVVPEDVTEISVTEDGAVFATLSGNVKSTEELGKIELARFTNPAGLSAIGKNVLKETAASGEPKTGTPGAEGFGRIAQRFLEMSNVNVVEEMVNMIVVQRAYEFNAKVIQTADAILGAANTIKR
ncbi:flagellar basal-body rod protein FlgG [bacterium]|nr:flagellar basal-body rod protein FlgG [bacterium]MBU2461739.1 flagellar basal-body rod protein FlgG [bacterium]